MVKEGAGRRWSWVPEWGEGLGRGRCVQEPETETGGVPRLTRERDPGPTCGVRDKGQTELRGRVPATKCGRGFRGVCGGRQSVAHAGSGSC
ncbi:unnamed protein product [Rangifer tarandus platyrhynchus]|uniref:Uncharacterized protein n=2 Tax=Rangifer tarandus platyrhynchus TaxID=3082113 RepID=A0ABN8YG43_RANTA|nr:unnamed protein product [Rangifer tarandus platyrhynchus]CAI9700301.1 unnamed protein product [Rangifer tarandus platyrhynchus]